MNKIICDICGSTYPETSECCPICGSSREFGTENPDYVPERMPEYIPESRKKAGLFSTAVKKVQDGLYDLDEPEFDAPMDILPEMDPVEDAVPAVHNGRVHANYFVVVILTVLIGLCVLVSGFLFFRFYLPHQFPEAEQTHLQETDDLSEETQESTELTVPCKSIVLTSGVPEITRIGQYWLLHVIVMPEDTTDQLTYLSSDESIVTVTEEGRLCSVGEGQTTVVISCGNEQILCQVTVKLPEEASTGEADDEGAALSDAGAEPAVDISAYADPSEELEAADHVVLKLKQSDISFTKKGVNFQLELDCDLEPEDVSWLTLDPDVAICHDGLITVLGNGTTRIVAQYGDQQAYCIIRCNFT